VPKVSEALSARVILLKLIVPKAQTLTLAHFSSLYTLDTFYKVAEGLIQSYRNFLFKYLSTIEIEYLKNPPEGR